MPSLCPSGLPLLQYVELVWHKNGRDSQVAFAMGCYFWGEPVHVPPHQHILEQMTENIGFMLVPCSRRDGFLYAIQQFSPVLVSSSIYLAQPVNPRSLCLLIQECSDKLERRPINKTTSMCTLFACFAVGKVHPQMMLRHISMISRAAWQCMQA